MPDSFCAGKVHVRFPFASCCPKQGNLGDIHVSLICSQVHGSTVRFIDLCYFHFNGLATFCKGHFLDHVWPEDAAGISEIPCSGRALKIKKKPFSYFIYNFSFSDHNIFSDRLKAI